MKNKQLEDTIDKKNTYIYKLEKLRDQQKEEIRRLNGLKLNPEALDIEKLAFRTEEAFTAKQQLLEDENKRLKELLKEAHSNQDIRHEEEKLLQKINELECEIKRQQAVNEELKIIRDFNNNELIDAEKKLLNSSLEIEALRKNLSKAQDEITSL